MNTSRDRHIERMNEPTAWLEHGESLLVAARILAVELSQHPTVHTDAERVKALGTFRGTMTLLGAGIECLLKGLAVSQGLLQSVDPRLAWKTGLRGADSHKLDAMAASLDFALSAEEADVVDRASTFLLWAGRYPGSKEAGKTSEAHAKGQLRFLKGDVDSADSIAARIRTLITRAA